jgi:site-specific DNA recombinase
MLSNQAYIGNMVQGKRRTRLSENEKQHFTDKNEWIIVENTHEAIVDKETFYAVRDLFAKKVEESTFSSE